MKPGDIDLSDPSSFARGFPHAYFKQLRREAPVSWNREQGGSGFWVITKYEDLKNVSKDPATFSSAIRATNILDPPEPEMPGLRAIMLNMDPPQHVKFRRLVQKGFTPRMVQRLESHIRERAVRIVDRVAARGQCEFVSEVAAELPMQVICDMVGVPEEDRRKVYDLSNLMIGFDDPEFQSSREDGKRAGLEMFMYAAKLAERARVRPGDDLATALVNAEVDGEKLTELEFNSFFLLLSVAGNETTRTVTSHGMRLLMEHSEQRARLVADPSRIPFAVEEILRFNPPVMYFRRTATRETEIRGVKIARGDKIVMWYPSVNRDEEVFDDPDRFDSERDPNEHLSFGIGEHFCLGANLARLELKIIFEELLRRLPDMEIAQPIRRLRSNFIDGIKEMRVRFTPASG
jgi:cholest-4-en-3-one 26-monooxygenase